MQDRIAERMTFSPTTAGFRRGCSLSRDVLLASLVALAVLSFRSTAWGQEAAVARPDRLAAAPAAAPQGLAEAPAEPSPSPSPPLPEWMRQVDTAFGDWLVRPLNAVLFYDFGTGAFFGSEKKKLPFVLIWLSIGAIFCTWRMNFISVRGFWHAIRLTKGDYDDPHDTGEVSHFQAIASALSGTLGLGNIAGVAIAIAKGGPGAVVWLIIAGFFGMSSKFVECTLGQMYRHVAADGTITGGPMRYLHIGLAERGWGKTGAVLAALFAVMCMGGAIGGGGAFQVGQSLDAIRAQIGFFDQFPWAYGLLIAALTGIVIIGGIRRIAATAEKIVPFMCGLYILASFYVIGVHADRIVPACVEIFQGAFNAQAMYGGFIGVMVIGVQRAAFSNEAGIGSAPIAHSAARTERPVAEGIVALLEPFIDTVVICSMTGLVIVITGVCNDPQNATLIANSSGSQLTSLAFGAASPWLPAALAVIVFLFAYATMITWSYYGERCWVYLFGPRTSIIYKLFFLAFAFLGSIVTGGKILEFSDLMIFSMALPNLVGIYVLSGKVRHALDDYWARYRAGEFEPRPDTPAS